MVSKWKNINIDEEKRKLIEARIHDIAQRLQNPEDVLRMNQVAIEQSKYHIWDPGYHLEALAEGPLGLALLYGELHKQWPGEGWDRLARTYFTLIDEQSVKGGRYELGLFSGISGRLFVAYHLCQLDILPQEVWRNLLKTILPAVDQFTGSLNLDTSPQAENYGLATGAVGIATILLTLARTTSISLELHMLLSHLLWLAQHDVEREKQEYAGWYHISKQLEQQKTLCAAGSAYPGSGMWNGLAGLLALLSISLLDGISNDKKKTAETLQILSRQLCQNMVQDRWKNELQQEIYDKEYHKIECIAPFAWCHGNYAIARAVWLAGKALHDRSLCKVAIDSVLQIGQSMRRQPAVTIGPSLCHGLAGMLQICCHFASNTGEPSIVEDALFLLDQLLCLFEPKRPFGYRAYEPEFIRVDTPWLLEGASGVALALLTAITPSCPTWSRILLLI